MSNTPFPTNIYQIDNHTLGILWSDNTSASYRLCDLQKRCPCAQCVDEKTGRRFTNEETTNNDVRAKIIHSVGRYAIKIEFTSGCSTGIYDFRSLYKWAKPE